MKTTAINATKAFFIDNSITRKCGFENTDKFRMTGNAVISTLAWGIIFAAGFQIAAYSIAYATGAAVTTAFTTGNVLGGITSLVLGSYAFAHVSKQNTDKTEESFSLPNSNKLPGHGLGKQTSRDLPPTQYQDMMKASRAADEAEDSE